MPGQIVTSPFRIIGNTGVTEDDDETADPVAAGMVVKWDPTAPSNWRAQETLVAWLERARAHLHGRGRYTPPDPRDPPARCPACRLGA